MRSFIGFIGALLVFVNFGLSNTLSYEFNVRDAGNATFDYVIVGSGTAGLTIAARLADQKFRMAVVEAGGYYELIHPVARVPGSCNLGAGADVHTTIRPNGASWPIEYLVQIFEIFIIQEGNAWVDRLHQTSVIYQDKSPPVQVYRQ